MSTDPIPISAAKYIAKAYGYDQVIIVARRIGTIGPNEIAEHVTTYGRDKANCAAAAKIGNFLKFKVMGWLEENESKSNGDGVEISRHPGS
jgi:hypothetical protein